MLKKVILFSLLFILAFSVFVLAKAPARVVWEQVLKDNAAVQSSLRSAGVLVKGVEGSVWDGKALVQYKGISSIVDWDMHLSGILSLTLPVMLDIDSQAGELDATVTLGLSGIELSVPRGDIELPPLNPLFRSQRVTLDGQLLIKGLRLQSEGRKLSFAEGLMSWSGGDIAYPAQRAIHQRNMPPFKVLLSTASDGSIAAGVRDSGGTFDVIEADLSPEGEALVKVKRRLLDIADEFWPQNSKEQDVVFKVKKNLY